MLTNKQYRVLKYIKKHRNITYKKLSEKYHKYDMSNILLILSPYVSRFNCEEIRDEDGFFTGEYQDINATYYSCNDHGILIVEQKQRDNLRWLIPVILSVIAIVISIVGLIF